MPDNVHHPEHYKIGGIEAIEYIKAKLGFEGTLAHCIGSAIAYLSRALYKGRTSEDLRKAAWYCLYAADMVEKKDQKGQAE